MQILVTSSIDKVGSETRDAIRQLVRNTLSRFAPRIAEVSVLVNDENGPRGGGDKTCRVSLSMPGFAPVSVYARHEKVMAAVSEAARRARRIATTNLKRRQSVRTRSRHQATVADTAVGFVIV